MKVLCIPISSHVIPASDAFSVLLLVCLVKPGDIDISLSEFRDAIGKDSGVFPISGHSSCSSSCNEESLS